ncbi:uncharacterized protein LOC117319775 [Pecten maximus]|uniref:uncharacterized protein LOC117319775 n=1 Tax=Pecten maximus TaxID=6579 RepID=UPI00145830C6|nr:uncharacterized protein LOC117319775 [Pecten maximus]
MSVTFNEANTTCSNTSAYLADDNNFEKLFKDCNNTMLFQAGRKQPEVPGDGCETVRMMDGVVQRNGPSVCSTMLPFVCISKESTTADNPCRIVNNQNMPGAKEPEEDDGGISFWWIILAAVLLVILVVIVICIVRKRRTPNKIPEEGNATFNNKTYYDSVRSHHEHPSHAGNSQARKDGEYGVLGQKPSPSPDDDMYAHTRQHQQEGEYDIFAKPVNDAAGIYDHTHNIRQLEGGEYGELGRRAQEVGEDDMYSHTKHSKTEGEYDSFSNTAVNNDAGGIYDRTHNVLMESAYDEFTGDKGNSAVEGLYDHT